MSDKTELALEVGAISIANKTTLTGALTGLAGWAASFNWIGLIGVIVAVAGLMANIFFQARRDRREAAESQARLDALKDRCNLP